MALSCLSKCCNLHPNEASYFLEIKGFNTLLIYASCKRKFSIAFSNFPKVQVAKSFLLKVCRLMFHKAYFFNDAKHITMKNEEDIESEKS